jgi:hypothetical protein
LAAHEVAHSFFYDRSRDVPVRLHPYGRSGEEAFCDAFAEALLAPMAAIGNWSGTAADVFNLATTLDVSVELLARTLAGLRGGCRAIIVAWSSTHDPRAFRVQWAGGDADLVTRAIADMARLVETPLRGTDVCVHPSACQVVVTAPVRLPSLRQGG